MKHKITEELEIPEGVNVSIEGGQITIEKEGNKAVRKFEGISIKRNNGKLILYTEKGTKREKKLIMTFKAHIKNMVRGLTEKFVYKLKICSVHFPITATVEGPNFIIKNFLGEATPRKAKIIEGVEVKVENENITVSSNNIEPAGQTAANIETATRVTGRDRRIFQDGIFITEKPGRKL
ncbi:MAG: 50S ribosomal protein L6 [archaeon]